MSKALKIIGIVAASIITGGAAGLAVGFASGFIGGLAGASFSAVLSVGTALASIASVAVAGAVSNALSGSSEIEGGGISPTYSFGPLKTQASNQLVRPKIYGKVKCAGNVIWQDHEGTVISRIVSFSDGEINGFSNVRFNDIPVNELSGCSYTPYTGNGTQSVDSRVPGATQTDKAAVVGGLKYDAYLAITAQASEKINGGFNVTAEVEGSKVRVYTTTSNYAIEYSNNPAWCLLDFLTSYNGCGIPFDEIDIQSFLDSAEYCDELVGFNLTGTVTNSANNNVVTGTNTKFKTEAKVGNKITVGSETKTITEISNDTSLKVDSNFTGAHANVSAIEKQKRFTLNLIIDVKKYRLDWLNDILLCCRGYLTYQDGKVGLKIEQVENAMQVFTPDNILTGSEKFWTTPREERYDIVKVQFIDPDNEYIKIYAQVEASTFQNEQPIVREIPAYGVTNFRQASRLAWFYLNQTITCNKYISFQTSKEGLDRTVGDVIQITSTFLGYVDKKMRIINMSEAQDGQIEIICKEYNPAIYNDTLGSAAPVYNVINLDNAFAPSADVQDFKASQNVNLIQFNWQAVSGESITYEIREGDSWNNSSIVATGLTGDKYSTSDIKRGTYKYWIKAKSKKGFYSTNAVLSILVITDIMSTNLVVSEDLLDADLKMGTFTNCFTRSNRVIPNSNINWGDAETWENSSLYYDTNGVWGSTVVNSFSYETPVYDIGADIPSELSMAKAIYSFFMSDESISTKVEWKYSEDNITWTNYQPFAFENCKFRYYRFKITMNTPLNKICSIDKFILNVDVLDRDLSFANKEITNAANGVTVVFAPSYVIVPSVVANISDGTSGYCVVSSKSKSQATVKAYNNSGTAITAKVDVRAKGY